MPTELKRERALAEFIRRLRRELPDNIVDLRLFGSEARREAAPDSDIDVLVVVRPYELRIALETVVVDIAFQDALARHRLMRTREALALGWHY